MSARLTAKQREFIALCDQKFQDGFDENFKPIIKATPYFFGPIQWEDWGFWTRAEAKRFTARLLERGLISSDKEFFYWITDAGRAALAANKEGQSHE